MGQAKDGPKHATIEDDEDDDDCVRHPQVGFVKSLFIKTVWQDVPGVEHFALAGHCGIAFNAFKLRQSITLEDEDLDDALEDDDLEDAELEVDVDVDKVMGLQYP